MNDLYWKITEKGLDYLKIISVYKPVNQDIINEYNCLYCFKNYGLLNKSSLDKILSFYDFKQTLNNLEDKEFIKSVIINEEIFQKIVKLQALL